MIEDRMAIKDSGTRKEFTTGSRRDSQPGKGRFDLLFWYVLKLLAIHMENGCVKYGDRNWEKGQPLSQYFNSAMRHMAATAMGLTDEPHEIATIWNMHCFVATKKLIDDGVLPKDLDDFPVKYEPLHAPPKPQQGYHAEVQLPGGADLVWVPIFFSNDRDALLSKVESSRRSGYSNRVLRITHVSADGLETVEHIFPGDKPVYSF